MSALSRFEAIQTFSVSNFSKVEKVMDIHTGKYYIQKSVCKNADPRIIKAFRQEVDLLSQLKKEHVPELIEVYEDGTHLFLVESWMDGICLARWMQTKPDYKSRMALFEQYLDLLVCIHACDYLYVDIKPEHLLVCDSTLYVIDFNGIAKIGTRTLHAISPIWAAPELAGKEEKNEACDVYGAGCLMRFLQLDRGRLKKVARSALAPKETRIQDIRQFQKMLRHHKKRKSWPASLLALVLIFTALFGTGSKKSNMVLELEAISRFEQEKQSQQSLDRLFYSWIDEGLLTDELMQSEQNAFYFVSQAIESENPVLCAFVLDLLDENMRLAHPEWAGMLSILSGIHSLDVSEWMQDYLLGLKQKADFEPDLNLLLRFGLASQRYLGMDEVLISLISSSSSPQTLSLFISYVLMCSNRKDTGLYIEEQWLSQADENTWNLYELYEQSRLVD